MDLSTRERIRPTENANSNLSDPPVMSLEVMEKPTHRSPKDPQMKTMPNRRRPLLSTREAIRWAAGEGKFFICHLKC
ncbi:MAG: hypothetical protein PUH24_01495 [Prevotellaceae bacterium]|nr:hypothetical protein [Prevotella sp.]MDD7256952.1 hypothetical protein [Prevotellaceae bacterium]MDY6131391.1 hypothetical protein [Prevotella sp.]